MTFTYRLSSVAIASLSAVALSACTEDTTQPTDSFISDDPVGADSGNGDGDAADTGGEGDPSTGGDEGGDGDGEGAPEISEADIVQIEGDRLYALSAYSGLTVVDVQDPDNMISLGTWETDAEPFEMYVEDGRAFVMFNDYGWWQWDEAIDEWGYQSSSRLVALDASNPSDIQVRGEFQIPGRIQDSRRVGDILYLVTLEDGYCWGCDNGQETVVTSLDISDEAHPVIVDQLEFAAPNDSWDWQRSVESTAERMYVASRTWEFESQGSVIDVVDISANDGSLVPGAQVSVAGSVASRWQMSEHEGVLRVISQPGWTDPPVIETFQIESAQSFVPLGEGTLTLPMPESLRSVRYDGARAYAITAEQTDPLFTIDLSDPTDPHQVGELEIPGWVYHMEPRGDQVLALGYDPGNEAGSINVSLFDVSDFATPTLTKRVHFGGDWAEFAEDQNRIHKAFTILEDEKMLLVPHTGWDYDEGSQCYYGDYRSGVQIIDWLNNDLTLRGLVPARGRVRRALTHAQRILTISDMELASFDYADRDAPAERDSLALAVHVDNLVRAGDVWVRLARNWWTTEQLLEVVDAADPASPEPLGVIDLGDNDDCEYTWVEQVFAEGDHVFVVQSGYLDIFDDNNYETTEGFARVTAVDISDPTNPTIVDTYDVPGERSYGIGSLAGVTTQSNWIAHQDGHIAFLTNDKDDQANPVKVQVLDLSDPSNLTLAATLPRPDGQTQGDLSVLSDTIVSWHTEPVEDEPGKVRFYFDRLDLDGEPHWQAKVNVPGVIVSYDAEDGHAYTVDFDLHNVALSPDDCYNHPKYWRFEWDDENYVSGTCVLIDRTLERLHISGSSATLIETIEIEAEQGLRQLYATDSRIFAHTDVYTWYGDNYDSYDYASKLVIVDTDNATVTQQDGAELGQWWWINAAEGDRAVVSANSSELTLVDATDVTALDIKHSSVPGWSGCYSPILDGDTVYCAMGPYGLETVEW